MSHGMAATGALGSFGAFGAYGDASGGGGGGATTLVSSIFGFGTAVANAVATGKQSNAQIAALQIQADAATKTSKDAIKLANKQLKLARLQGSSTPVSGGDVTSGDSGTSAIPSWLAPAAAVVVVGGTVWMFRKQIMRAFGRK